MLLLKRQTFYLFYINKVREAFPAGQRVYSRLTKSKKVIDFAISTFNTTKHSRV